MCVQVLSGTANHTSQVPNAELDLTDLCRAKADLQEVVVSAGYNAQRVTRAEAEETDENALSADSFAAAKSILLDDDGFWCHLVMILRASLPIVKLLRMLDGNKPVLGKVYDRMFLITQKLKKSTGAPWLSKVLEIHESRWEYLHSDMHSAAYALDPEFQDLVVDIDDATQEGLQRVFERLSLRDAILSSADPEAASRRLTLQSEEVVKRVAQAELEFSQYQGKEQAFGRASAQLNAKQMAPAKWWRTYGKTLPLLCSFACTVLAQVAAASACERNWSVYGRVREGRGRLGHVKSDKLVYAHEAMALHDKLLDAGYVDEVEDWDDSDSDASSEADLTVAVGDEELGYLAR